MTRRQLFLLSGAGAILPSALSASEAQNLAYPLREIQGTLTSPDLFFVRDHFSEPQLSLETWQLRIEGRVAHPYQLGFSDLLELPSKKVEAVLECSGNAANGSAASNGIWEGVPISYLLEPAGIDREAAFIAFEGADTGRLFQNSPSLAYAQLVPLEKCLDASSLVAFKLNDLYLPRRNGFPARALFPGWYAMDSVKWVRRIMVLNSGDRQCAFYQSGMDRVYNRVVRTDDGPRITRLSAIQVKSVIAWPSDKMNLPAGRHLVWGFAWSGGGAIREVAVSIDGGRTWNPAQVQTSTDRFRWARWSYAWNPSPGDYVMMSRATDSQGSQQPVQRDKTRKDIYELNWCAPLQCNVR